MVIQADLDLPDPPVCKENKVYQVLKERLECREKEDHQANKEPEDQKEVSETRVSEVQLESVNLDPPDLLELKVAKVFQDLARMGETEHVVRLVCLDHLVIQGHRV